MKQNLLCDVPPAVLPRNRSRAAPDCPPRFAADDIKRRSGSKPWVGAGRLGPPLFAKDRQNLGVALDSMPQTHMREQTSPRAQHGKSKQGTKHVSCPRPPPPPPAGTRANSSDEVRIASKHRSAKSPADPASKRGTACPQVCSREAAPLAPGTLPNKVAQPIAQLHMDRAGLRLLREAVGWRRSAALECFAVRLRSHESSEVHAFRALASISLWSAAQPWRWKTHRAHPHTHTQRKARSAYALAPENTAHTEKMWLEMQ